MAIVAPWLQPPNVLGAMQSGASLGLQLRGQNLAAQEAEARRQAAIARMQQEDEQFAGRQQHAADALRLERDIGAARLTQAASEAAALAGHRTEQRKLDEAAQALRVRAENRLQRAQTFEEEQAKAKAAAAAVQPKVVEVDGQRVIQLGPNRYQYLGEVVPTEKLPASVRRGLLNDSIAEVDAALRFLESDLRSGEKARVESATQERDKLLEQRRRSVEQRNAMLKPTASALSAPAAPSPAGALPSPKTKAQYDALPSGARYLDPNGVERVKK